MQVTCRPAPCARPATLRPSMSPSWRSSAARSASTLGALRALARAMSAPAPGFWPAWPAPRPGAPTALGDDFAGQRFGIGRGGNGPRMAHADIASHQRLAHEIRKIEQSQQVGDMAARLVDDLADVFLGVAVALDQLAIALGLLDRVEVLALDILDQREFGRRRHRRCRGRSPGSCAAAPAAPRASGARRRRSRSRRRAGRSRIGWSTPRSAIDCGELVERFLVEMQCAAGWGCGGSARSRSRERRRGRARRRRTAAACALAEQAPTGPCRGRRCGRSLAHAASASCGSRADQLARQRDIGFGAGAAEVVDQRRQAVARRLGQAHVARHDGLEHRRAEAGADVVGDRLRQIVTAVEHRQRDAEDRQLRIERERGSARPSAAAGSAPRARRTRTAAAPARCARRPAR